MMAIKIWNEAHSMSNRRETKSGFSILLGALAMGSLATITCLISHIEAAQPAAAVSRDRMSEQFLVRNKGYVLLGPDGEEKERLEAKMNGAGAFSPDGKWVAFSRSGLNERADQEHGELVVESRAQPREQLTVPLVWGVTGSSFTPLWSSDSGRILICEQGFNRDRLRENVRVRESAFRIFDLGTRRLTTLKLPDEWLPTDWSSDGKHLLTSLRVKNGSSRLAWVSIHGQGEPDFLTSDRAVAYGARLSPDDRKILCMVRKLDAAPERLARLCVIDLVTKKEIVIDKPGHTYGYCWSSDGSKIAYTWQMPIRKAGETDERKTYLITCDADGGNSRTITMRQYEVAPNNSGRNGVIMFFEVLAWWR
jgi:Tol biopolymer transport system component